MGGKNYFCDYCCCYMKNDINVRKLHNSGMSHQIAKVRCQRPIEDPLKVYESEILKAPCSRFQKGYCKFDLFCHFRHYSDKQLEQLKKIGERQARKSESKSKHKAETKPVYWDLLPWNLNGATRCQRKRNPKNLPKSLQPINFNLLKRTHVETEWG